MFEALFGPEMPLAARLFLALLVVLGLIGGAAYLVRRFGADRLGAAAARGRQPRLAVIDAAPVDSRRRLVLIRRDNIEHLLLIGGPTDVVVEPNIVRGAPVAQPARAPEPAQRAAPAPAIESGLWPLQPEPARAARPIPAEDTTAWSLQPLSEPRIPADPLAGLTRDVPREREIQRERDVPREPPREMREPREVPRLAPVMHEPPVAIERPAPPPSPDLVAADQNLAEMAQRLEAALRRPGGSGAGPAPEPRAKPAAKMAKPAPAPAPEPKLELKPEPKTRTPVFSSEPPARAAEPKAAQDGKPPHAKAVYDSLEQEMASLLGRPNDKT